MRINDGQPVVTVENVLKVAYIVCLILMWALSAAHLASHHASNCGPTAGSTATSHPSVATDCPH
ncbi:hypothetical protein [Streptomyces sp. NRRL B-24484]|uniref:hypothetical protein n=1 Tax=Streptomyces sp. NRRL B-24484 TaxID=1463833 RepID=UPI0004BF1967|nr:hypothetical protein [Streptomyces sp. NRRL B-24484]